MDFLSKAVKRIALLLGLDVCNMGDQEASIKDLGARIVKLREDETLLRWAPVGSSASNGRAERMIQTTRKQLVTTKL